MKLTFIGDFVKEDKVTYNSKDSKDIAYSKDLYCL